MTREEVKQAVELYNNLDVEVDKIFSLAQKYGEVPREIKYCDSWSVSEEDLFIDWSWCDDPNTLYLPLSLLWTADVESYFEKRQQERIAQKKKNNELEKRLREKKEKEEYERLRKKFG